MGLDFGPAVHATHQPRIPKCDTEIMPILWNVSCPSTKYWGRNYLLPNAWIVTQCSDANVCDTQSLCGVQS